MIWRVKMVHGGVVVLKSFFLVLLCCQASGLMFDRLKKGIDGGIPCATCTLSLSLVEQLAIVHNESISNSLARFCNYLPSEIGIACEALVKVFEPIIIDLFAQKENPDVICHTLHICRTDPGQEHCYLYPKPKEGFDKRLQKTKHVLTRHKRYLLEKLALNILPSVCKLPGVREFCEWVERLVNDHRPGVDIDNDGFSVFETLRGSSWRGKDCRDSNPFIHPGARPVAADTIVDSNCNGIYSFDDRTGQAYEDLFCKDTDQRGVVVLGDSVSAHFHIPVQWFTPKDLSVESLSLLPFALKNELDWPQLSSVTGHQNNTFAPLVEGPVDSIYLRLLERNRCNHRDYQNLAVNGADGFKMQFDQQRLSRNQTADFPLLIFYAVVGNDVCNHFPDTEAHMTTPAQMRENLLKTLAYLDAHVPENSHVLLVGLANGSYLWEAMHDRYHPLGRLRKDLKYEDAYRWLNCIQVSPCQGWWSYNATLREITTRRAKELSAVLADVAHSNRYKYKNLEINFMNCPVTAVVNEWKIQGGKVWQLIEEVDGFHPNQVMTAMVTEYTWNYMKKYLPHYLGRINPHNEEIRRKFGDQGGY